MEGKRRRKIFPLSLSQNPFVFSCGKALAAAVIVFHFFRAKCQRKGGNGFLFFLLLIVRGEKTTIGVPELDG